jgi:hypothetical protein
MAPDHRAFVVDKETWTHVAFVWNGSAVGLYVDGAQIVETFAIAGRTVPDNTNHPYTGGGNGALCGGIRELAIYDRALSTTIDGPMLFCSRKARCSRSAWHFQRQRDLGSQRGGLGNTLMRMPSLLFAARGQTAIERPIQSGDAILMSPLSNLPGGLFLQAYPWVRSPVRI